jgi:hypothetical protein
MLSREGSPAVEVQNEGPIDGPFASAGFREDQVVVEVSPDHGALLLDA